MSNTLIHLNGKMWSDTLPEKLKGICPEEEYRKSQLYDKDNKKLSFWSSTFNLAVILVMIIAGGFSVVDGFARIFSMNLIVVSLIFFLVIGLASDLINIPFSWYDTFVIEKKYGFNTMTVRTFITDHIKSWFIALLVGIPVLGLITWFYYKTGPCLLALCMGSDYSILSFYELFLFRADCSAVQQANSAGRGFAEE